MHSSVWVARIYYRNEPNYNAGTANFVYVAENTVLKQAWPQILKKWATPYLNLFLRKS